MITTRPFEKLTASDECRLLQEWTQEFLGDSFHVECSFTAHWHDSHPHLNIKLEGWRKSEPDHSGFMITAPAHYDDEEISRHPLRNIFRSKVMDIISELVNMFYYGTYFEGCAPFPNK